MRSQFTPQGGKFAALATLQERLRDTERASETGDDATDS